MFGAPMRPRIVKRTSSGITTQKGRARVAGSHVRNLQARKGARFARPKLRAQRFGNPQSAFEAVDVVTQGTARVESRASGARRKDIAQERVASGIANNPNQDTNK